MSSEELKELKTKSWYWVLVDGYDFYIPCWFYKNEEELERSYFLPAGLGDSSSMGIYLDDIEKIGNEITPPEV
jgi:hypothetical protein